MTQPTRRDALRLGAAFMALPMTVIVANADEHAATHTVVIKDFSFNPASITIAAGDIVTFINEDSASHSATDLSGAFDTGLLSKGQQASLTFGSAGTFNYRCTPHSNMRGMITIS